MAAISPAAPTFTLQDRYTKDEGQVYLSGLQALVRLLLDQRRADRLAGLKTGTFVSGYPGSPVGGLDVELGRQKKLLVENDIYFQPAVNEDLAATAVFGAQLAQTIPGAKFEGVTGLWYGKAPGVDRTVDAFRHGIFRGMGRNGGILAVAGDDPAAKSSIIPNDSNLTYYGLSMPIVTPSDIQDVLDLGLHGFRLSRVSGLPVGFKMEADIADGAGTAFVDGDRVRPVVPIVEIDGKPFVPTLDPNIGGVLNIPTERTLLHGRLEMARAYGRDNRLNPVSGAGGDALITLAAPGKTYLDVIEALRLLGIREADLAQYGIRLMKVGMPFPMHPDDLRAAAAGVKEVFVIEEKRPFVETFFKDVLFTMADRPRLLGKTAEDGTTVLPDHGVLNPELIATAVAARLDALRGSDELRDRLAAYKQPTVTRAPLPIMRIGTFCSGCPHTTGLKAPEDAVVGGGIGCHIMAVGTGRPIFGDLVGYTQMGGEGAQWVGAAPFTDTKHFIQNLGDGTFAHSGSLAIRFAVASKLNVTYKLLFNSAVAMTGGQDAVGGMNVKDTIELLLAEGVKKVVVTTEDPSRYRGLQLPGGSPVRHRDDIIDVQRELAEVPGVTVLLHDQQCAIEKRRMRRRGELKEPDKSVVINERVCEGCGDCGKKSSCLSVLPVETDFGRKTQIHQSSCSKDFSCLQGDCPSFMTVKVIKPKAKVKAPTAVFPDIEPPAPAYACSPEHFELHMSGIGGTGVITVNQILGTAAAIAGRSVRALDQFGGSQKAGAVTSHLKVSSTPTPASSTIANGSADGLLVFDVLTATEPPNIAKADQSKTVAIVSTHKVATGGMVVNPSLQFPETPLFSKVIDKNSRQEDNVYVDAQTIAERLLGSHLASNLFLTGMAYQKGLIPLELEHIERAIELNGVAVEMNKNAFRWGRLAVSHPAAVDEALRSVQPSATSSDSRPAERDPRVEALVGWADGSLREALELRAADLIGYQDLAYAKTYVDFVKQAHEAELRVGADTRLSQEVAVGLHKLMAYKDEYEVARLHLDSAERAKVTDQFGDRAKVYWHLHPPMLRALGVDKKLVLGPWFAPAFKALRGMRRVRGTRADVFGYAKVRRTERQLVAEYRETLQTALARLSLETLDAVVELAGLPEMVRGYEEIKLGNVERYQARRVELLEALGPTPAELAA